MSKKQTPPPAPQPSAQGELFKAETTWFHIFKEMIDSGDVAKMGSHAFTVYAVIKAHTNFSTGRAFPALETIVEKSGVSLAQVKRELVTLEEFGYISKVKEGRKNVYTLREKIQVKDDSGRPVAAATWDYLPSSVQHAVADLRRVMVTGEFEGAKIVCVERLQVNVVHVTDGGVNININDLIAKLDDLPKETREILAKRLNPQNVDKSGQNA